MTVICVGEGEQPDCRPESVQTLEFTVLVFLLSSHLVRPGLGTESIKQTEKERSWFSSRYRAVLNLGSFFER